MNLLLAGIAWILDPANHVGPNSIGARLSEHLAYTFGAVALAAVIAVPLGYLIGHTGKGRELAVTVSGGFRALPSFGLLIVLALVIGIGFRAPLITFVILAVPPLLAGAYSGVQAVEKNLTDSGRSVGMTEWQILTRIEIPLGLPLLIGGVRSAVLQVVATATLAAFATGGALGGFILSGLSRRDYPEMLGASIVIIVLALVLEGLMAVVQRLVVPPGVALTAAGREHSS